jgi:hypothetical protein
VAKAPGKQQFDPSDKAIASLLSEDNKWVNAYRIETSGDRTLDPILSNFSKGSVMVASVISGN